MNLDCKKVIGFIITVLVVVKIGTSSVTDNGEIDVKSIRNLCDQVTTVKSEGHDVVIVTSGAVTAGIQALGFNRKEISDIDILQAASAIGQSKLMAVYDEGFKENGLLAGQVLLAPLDFINRNQYLKARDTFEKLLELGVIPVVNENDAIADEELRFGDNDRLSALVAHLLNADVLLMLTDQEGVFTADPRLVPHAKLIEEVEYLDLETLEIGGGPGTDGGSGGMASKLQAAKIATWSGVKVIIAASERNNVVVDVVVNNLSVGTSIAPLERRLSARKLWIAFASMSKGKIVIDEGARAAIAERGKSLLPAGITVVIGKFSSGDAIDILGPSNDKVAKGIIGMDSSEVLRWKGMRTQDLPEGVKHEVVHRDDMVIM